MILLAIESVTRLSLWTIELTVSALSGTYHYFYPLPVHPSITDIYDRERELDERVRHLEEGML